MTSNTLTDTNAVRLKIAHMEFVPSADQPEFSSGWHTHPGPVIVQVQEGEFKVFQGGCTPNIVRAGETYIEVPEVPALVTAKRAVEWTTTLIRDDTKLDRTNLPSSPCP